MEASLRPFSEVKNPISRSWFIFMFQHFYSELASDFPGSFLIVPVLVSMFLVLVLVVLGLVFEAPEAVLACH